MNKGSLDEPSDLDNLNRSRIVYIAPVSKVSDCTRTKSSTGHTIRGAVKSGAESAFRHRVTWGLKLPERM